ncbi:MAG: MlaC/ttg2D family ABC transporter substrate-binding protein [Myxococcota bacterium]
MRASLLAALLVASLSFPVSAATETPLATVRTTLEEASAIMANGTERNARIASLHEVARELLDTRTMGRRVLGRRLDEESPEARERFYALFDELIVRAWLQRLLLFETPRFEYAGTSTEREQPVVHTKIRTEVDSYGIDYEMRQRSQIWMATDIRVEGISLLRNYRSQFKRLLERQSFEEVLDRMDRKVKVLSEDEA